MADEDRIREFLKLQKQIKQDPKRIAAVIKQWMAEDTKPKNRPKKWGIVLAEKHTAVQKVWWWVVTLYYLTRDIDVAIERLQERQACAKGSCALPSAAQKENQGN
jgi:hypothetical protein